MKKFFGLVVLALTFLLIDSVAFADGCYFPARAMKDYPSIPSQRAVVVYRGGMETLIIESALEGEGTEFGWVIPLPSVPTEFDAVGSGFIETLSHRLQPRITHDAPGIGALIILTAVILIWFFVFVVAENSPKPLRSLAAVVLLFLLIGTFLAMPLLNGGIRPNVCRTGIEIINSQEIGSYEVVVLEVKDADSLNHWLGTNGFIKLDKKAENIVTDYIEAGWCFVTAKLKRQTDGFSVPHPMSLKFASEEAVYPMRLTSMADSDVYLELYVIANKMAKAKGMELEFCDIYKFDEAAGIDRINEKELPGFSLGRRDSGIGHSQAFNHIWDGCVISRLAGTFEPDEMEEDIALELGEASPYRKHYYSYWGAMLSGGMTGMLTLCALLTICTVIYGKRIRAAGGRRFAVIHIGLKCTVICILLAGGVFAVLDKVKVRSGPKLPARFIDAQDTKVMSMEIDALRYYYKGFAGMSASQVRQGFEEYFQEEGSENYHTGQKRKNEDSPGNFTVLEDERGVVLRCYLSGGFPVDFVIDDLK